VNTSSILVTTLYNAPFVLMPSTVELIAICTSLKPPTYMFLDASLNNHETVRHLICEVGCLYYSCKCTIQIKKLTARTADLKLTQIGIGPIVFDVDKNEAQHFYQILICHSSSVTFGLICMLVVYVSICQTQYTFCNALIMTMRIWPLNCVAHRKRHHRSVRCR
jgi:hypothetical protein